MHGHLVPHLRQLLPVLLLLGCRILDAQRPPRAAPCPPAAQGCTRSGCLGGGGEGGSKQELAVGACCCCLRLDKGSEAWHHVVRVDQSAGTW
jgi:hypothetical protein